MRHRDRPKNLAHRTSLPVLTLAVLALTACDRSSPGWSTSFVAPTPSAINASLSGTVSDAFGNPIADVEIVPLKSDWDTVRTDASGTFAFPTRALPSGWTTVTGELRKAGYERLWWRAVFLASQSRTTLALYMRETRPPLEVTRHGSVTDVVLPGDLDVTPLFNGPDPGPVCAPCRHVQVKPHEAMRTRVTFRITLRWNGSSVGRVWIVGGGSSHDADPSLGSLLASIAGPDESSDGAHLLTVDVDGLSPNAVYVTFAGADGNRITTPVPYELSISPLE